MAKKLTAIVTRDLGLDIDALVMLMRQINKYPDVMKIKYNGKQTSLKSVTGCMSLSVPTNGIFEIEAQGENEDEIIRTLTEVMIREQIAKPYNG